MQGFQPHHTRFNIILFVVLIGRDLSVIQFSGLLIRRKRMTESYHLAQVSAKKTLKLTDLIRQ
jgi:hypothetical protein